jgi:hypothetical protein
MRAFADTARRFAARTAAFDARFAIDIAALAL